MQETRLPSPGLGRSPGEGNGNPLEYSCLENPMHGRASQATVYGVAKSRPRLSNATWETIQTFRFRDLGGIQEWRVRSTPGVGTQDWRIRSTPGVGTQEWRVRSTPVWASQEWRIRSTPGVGIPSDASAPLRVWASKSDASAPLWVWASKSDASAPLRVWASRVTHPLHSRV